MNNEGATANITKEDIKSSSSNREELKSNVKKTISAPNWITLVIQQETSLTKERAGNLQFKYDRLEENSLKIQIQEVKSGGGRGQEVDLP